MDNEQAEKIIKLLKQIRDLQQQHNENHSRAILNQEESIALQKNALGRYRKVLFPAVLVAVILIIIAILMVLQILTRYWH